jgi:hypothetical protein
VLAKIVFGIIAVLIFLVFACLEYWGTEALGRWDERLKRRLPVRTYRRLHLGVGIAAGVFFAGLLAFLIWHEFFRAAK